MIAPVATGQITQTITQRAFVSIACTAEVTNLNESSAKVRQPVPKRFRVTTLPRDVIFANGAAEERISAASYFFDVLIPKANTVHIFAKVAILHATI